MRLTKRLYDANKENYAFEVSEALNKLGQLEDIEDELDIDLITLYTAETRGFYYKSKDGEIYWSGNQFVRVGMYFVKTEPCYQVKKTTLESCYFNDKESFIAVRDAHYWDWNTHDQVKISDYGKTWALTKEELL